MLAKINYKNQQFTIDLSKPLDISIPLKAGNDNPSAWYVPPVSIKPVIGDHFVGSVKEGGSVNFRDITFNPHGHGTHTECVGHITEEVYSINQSLKQFFFLAQLVSIEPEKTEENAVITLNQVKSVFITSNCDAFIIRTLPNATEKQTRQYSNTNPPYISAKAVEFLISKGINHLLIDLPSVDKEVDNGELAAHNAFWEYPSNTNFNRTITELIYVPDEIKDGKYILNIQIAPFENDASPSKPILYKIK